MTPVNVVTKDLSPDQTSIVAKLTMKMVELGCEAKFVTPVGVGPVISAFRFFPQGRTTVAKLESLANDFAVCLGVEDVLVKRMPGESAVGVFVPNAERRLVDFRDVVGNVWSIGTHKIPLAFGVDQMGKMYTDDLTLMPHLLIAGTTGSGKSTLLASLLATVVYSCNTRDVRLVLSDTKGVEFRHFIGSPHLMFDIATSVYQTLEQMDAICDEMEERLKRIGRAGVRNILEYNEIHEKNPEKSIITHMPYIVLVIDELADIMLYKGEKRGESKLASGKLSKIVQKSRAAGVHVIASTQRPSVDIVAGSIKANFPARLSFRLPSDVDSKTVLGTPGAEHLLSRGDMLFVSPNRPGLTRLHAPYASINDIKAAVEVATMREVSQ